MNKKRTEEDRMTKGTKETEWQKRQKDKKQKDRRRRDRRRYIMYTWFYYDWELIVM